MSFDKESYIIGKNSSKDTGGFALKSLLATENGGYHAPAGSAYAYVKVSVDKGVVPEGTLEIAENGNGIDVSAYEKVNVNVPQGVFPSGTVQISENGTYDVSAFENAEVFVSGSGDAYEKLNEYLDQSIAYFKSGNCTSFMVRSSADASLNNLVFYSAKNITAAQTFGGLFYNCGMLKYANLGYCGRVTANVCNNARNLKTMILRKNTAPATLENTSNAISDSRIGKGAEDSFLYVPDFDVNGENLVSKYKTATNWTKYADNIRGYSEAPLYDPGAEYSIGDVCRFENKLYGYCKEDLTSSVGNAPSGTAEDNTYWEYIDDITVI